MEFSIQLQRKNKTEFYTVWVKIKYRNAWRFLQSFYTYDRAANFISQVKKDFEKGDCSWLTLKS